MLSIVISIFEQGLIYGIMALGIYISYKILDFPDLSVDGTFPLGAAVPASLMIQGVNTWLCIPLSAVAGCLAGMLTGFFHVKLKIKDLLSGILTMTALYSINYRIAGAPNQFLMGNDTVFTVLDNVPSYLTDYKYIIIIVIAALIMKYILDAYLATKSGFLLRSVGDNESLVVTLAQNPGKVKVIGLAVSNAFVAVSGSLACQRSMQFDITSGTGTLVMGLAAVIIGTTLFKKIKFMRLTSGVLIGMIIYKACITLSISSGMASSDTNLIITILFVLTLLINDFTNVKGNGGKKNA
ncbi:MAG: ABC transporter permease [Clostridia bacterium]|nr:ABC transporter permease [Clostridia bacterium]